jgi:hypothetical protein
MVRAFQSGLDSSPIMETELGGRSHRQPNLQQTRLRLLNAHDAPRTQVVEGIGCASERFGRDCGRAPQAAQGA